MSCIKGAFSVDAQIFSRWEDSGNFLVDFRDIVEILSSRSGLKIGFDEAALRVVHDRWLKIAEAWVAELLPESSKHLSHLKMMAILLELICQITPFKVEGAPEQPENHSYQDAGHSLADIPNRMNPADVTRIIDGQSQYIGWQICYHVCKHFEVYRTDKSDPFVDRITERFEMDVVSALLSGRVSAQAAHLILKALFLRD